MYDTVGYDDWKTTDPDYEGMVSCPDCGDDRYPDEPCECGSPVIEPDYEPDQY